MKKRLPIGNDDFAEVRRQNLYFIDKSLMIRDSLDTGDKVTLITRPRRFGKTLPKLRFLRTRKKRRKKRRRKKKKKQ